ANIFCIVEPLTGQRLTFASANRKRPAYVRALQKIAARYSQAKRIHLVQDNLNTHSLKSAVAVLGALEGRRLWRRFEVHYTPKHASWLNAAGIEASLVSRECLGRDRLAFLVDLISRVAAWRRAAEDEGRTPSTGPFVSMMRDGSFATMGSSPHGRRSSSFQWSGWRCTRRFCLRNAKTAFKYFSIAVLARTAPCSGSRVRRRTRAAR